jgi:hypothetical protein
MSNHVTYGRRPDIPSLKMSNGSTSVFVSVLSLAASALAKSDRARELAVWLASHDQSVFGLGVVGFDIGELPWSLGTFAEDRGFVLEVIAAVRVETGWDRLGYRPREDLVSDCIDVFGTMIASFDVRDAAAADEEIWRFCDKPDRFETCPIHGVYLHVGGCVVCNDA